MMNVQPVDSIDFDEWLGFQPIIDDFVPFDDDVAPSLEELLGLPNEEIHYLEMDNPDYVHISIVVEKKELQALRF